MSNVLIMNLNWRQLSKIGRLAKHNPHPALELLYVSASLNKNKIKHKLIDLWSENKDLNDYAEEIKKSDIVVIDTAPSYTFWRDGTIDAKLSEVEIERIKKINPNINVVVVGPHGTVTPEVYFNTKVDYILRGEPDLEFTELVKQIRKKKITLKTVCYKKKGKWIIGKQRANVQDMSKLPILPYEKLNFSSYCWPNPPIKNVKRTIVYETSRGCPFNCIFCFRAGFRGNFRTKNINQIAKELEKLKGKVDYVYLIDETFGINAPWTKQVCGEFKKRNIKWGCETRPECLNKNIIDIMADSGCGVIHLGLESANKEVLKALNKGTINLVKLKQDIEYMVKKGIHVKLYCTAGSPKETKESLRETLKYILQFDLLKVNASINAMIPYPETALWELGKKEGRKLKTWEDIQPNMGIIGNNFKKPSQVMNEVSKFNAHILKKKSALIIKGKFHIIKKLKFVIVWLACNILIMFPKLFNLFYKFYRFV